MPAQLETKTAKFDKPRRRNVDAHASGTLTQIGWQGIRFTLPPDWNLTGFAMNYENGYLRVDAPGDTALTVQVRWMNAAKPEQSGPPNLYTLAAPTIRKWLRRPTPSVQKPDLRANLERLLKETAKQAKKAKAAFDSTIKNEKAEGENAERTAMNFTWTGEGRGQGKIWHCATCNRIVVAQVIGMGRDQAAIASVASQLFSTFRDHAVDGYHRWALYDLQVDVPEDFRLEAQKLLSGHLHLEWGRQAERIVLDRWGLANMTLKKFTLSQWFRNNAIVNVTRLSHDGTHTVHGHASARYWGALPVMSRIRALRESRATLKRFPTRYEGGIWNCPVSNKLISVQTLYNRRTEGLWEEVVSRCVCHDPLRDTANDAANETDEQTTEGKT